MRRRYLLINLALLAIALIAGLSLFLYKKDVLTKESISVVNNNMVNKIEKVSSKEVTPEVVDLGKESEVIVKKDLFNPQRSTIKEVKEKKAQEVVELQPPPMPPVPQLKGITILPNDAIAYMVDSVTKIEGVYRVNDRISEFLIIKIDPKKITLLYGETEIAITLEFK